MKKTILFIFGFLLSTLLMAQLFEHIETFDSGIPDDWYTIVNTGTCDWTSSADMPIGQDFVSPAMLFNDFECGSGAAASNATLYSAVYDLSGTSGVVYFDYDYSFKEIGAGETFTIEYFSNVGWETLIVYDTSTDVIVSESWTGTESNADFQWRFTYDDAGGSHGWGAGFDSFYFASYKLSSPDEQITGFSMYPNPATNIVMVKAQNQIQIVALFNILGQKVLTVAPNALSQEINVATLKAGVYIVNVTSGEQVGSYRLIKQ